MKTNFRMTKLRIFCIIAYIVVQNIAACRSIFSTASANTLPAASSNTLIARKANSQNSKDIYIPPDYGGPDSHHGSGTR
ncbi:hypothetical protein LC605_30245 [Nostoc sp. CHAB 5836]|uniref:hypothetical protein n=1 Tax=Nostoc sp. CHAB 5836 TaxID=2780404 RepID=UPI001E55423B|nr:hypothetical protein [Nostoc sp. CHAB 5836]MCC5619274.1 hypothetical protein [Nostoc sp. CHAB 5836]